MSPLFSKEGWGSQKRVGTNIDLRKRISSSSNSPRSVASGSVLQCSGHPATLPAHSAQWQDCPAQWIFNSSTFPPSVLSPVPTWTVSVWVPQSCEKRRGQAQLNYGSPGVEAGPEDCPAGQQERQQGNWTRGHWSELAKPPRSSKWKGEEARMIWSGLVVKSGAHLKNRIRWYIGAKGFTWLVYKLFQFLEKVS